LNTALSPVRTAQGSPPDLYWEVRLSSYSGSQIFCLTSPLLAASLAPLGVWLVDPSQFSAFVTFPVLNL
jgi:hypothetical protein